MGFRPLADCRDGSGFWSNDMYVVVFGYSFRLRAVNDVGMNVLHIVYLFRCRNGIHHYY